MRKPTLPTRVTRRAVLQAMGTLGLASATGTLSACIPQGRLKRPLEMTPRALDDGWELGTPEEVGLDPARVRAAYERVFSEDEFINALSLLVVCKGKLVAEGYVQRESDITRREHVQSVTKSLTSMAFGVLRGEGHFPDLDASLAEFLPVTDPRKEAITLRHLLTMRSGIGVDNYHFATDLLMAKRRHMTRFLLDQPLRHVPGQAFDYRDCDPQLIGSVTLAKTGQSIESVMRRHILEPLGIWDVTWQHNADGEPLTAHGVWLRARDLAKLGELAHRRGMYQGRQLVPADWLDEACREQSDTGNDPGTRDFAYGFYFWIVPEIRAYSTWGHGGNFMLVVPEAELVLVLTSMPDAGNDIGSELRDVVSLAKMMAG